MFAPDGRLAARKVFSRRDVVVAVGPGRLRPRPGRAGPGGRRVVVGPRDRPPRRRGRRPGAGLRPARRSSPSRPPSPPTFLNGVDADRRRRRPVERRRGGHRPQGEPSWAGRSPTARPTPCGRSPRPGRRMELVVGVAGAGKTTALACVRDAYEAAGLPGDRHVHVRAGRPHPGPGGRHREPHDRLAAVAPRPRPPSPSTPTPWSSSTRPA